MVNGMNLNNYLSGKEAEDAAIVTVHLPPLPVKKTKMLDILVDLDAISSVAKDWHYRAGGEAFFGNHQLADLIWTVRNISDEINEIYYMGQMSTNPPFSVEVKKQSVDKINSVLMAHDERSIVEAVFVLLKQMITDLDNVRNDQNLNAGVLSILDEASKKALMYSGFVDRVLKNRSDSPMIDADAQ